MRILILLVIILALALPSASIAKVGKRHGHVRHHLVTRIASACDAQGNPLLDAQGNPIQVLDAQGNPIYC